MDEVESTIRCLFLKQMWSYICCCSSSSKKNSNHNEAQGRSQNGSYLLKGRVYPCRRIAPVYQELASTYTSMIFVTVDVEELAEFSNQWNVEATPTIVFLKDGRQMDMLVGGDPVEIQKKTAAVADLMLRKPTV